MKTATKQIRFDFWKENKLALHFQVTPDKLIELWQQWKEKQKEDWYEYYYGQRAVTTFLCSDIMSKSSYELSQFDEIYKTLKPYF